MHAPDRARYAPHRLRRTLGALAGIAALLGCTMAIPQIASAAPVCKDTVEQVPVTTRALVSLGPSYESMVDVNVTVPVTSRECTDTVTNTVTETVTVPTTVTTTLEVPTTVTTTLEVPTTVTTTVEVPVKGLQGSAASTVTTTVEVPVDVPTTVEVPVEVPTTVVIPTTLSDETTVFETVIDGIPTTVTEVSNSVVQQTWAFAGEVNPATDQVPALSLSAYDVQAGQDLTVSVQGFTPGETVQIYMNSEPVLLGQATANESGSATQVVTIPANAVAGLHTIRVVGVTCGIDASVPIRVSPAAATDSTDSLSDAVVPLDPYAQLSSTGFDAGSGLWLAVALLVAGSGALLLGRIRVRSVTSDGADSDNANLDDGDADDTDLTTDDSTVADLLLGDSAEKDPPVR